MLIEGLADRVVCNYFSYEKILAHVTAKFEGKKPPANMRFPIHLPKPTPEEMLHPFPAFFCMAAVAGLPVGNLDSSSDVICSRVYCGWFTDDINLPVNKIVRAGIRPFDWDAIAENCEL